MQWQRMTPDDYASLQQASKIKTIKIDNIWWMEVKPYFYRPLLPWMEIEPDQVRYPLKSLIGGVQHIVPQGMKTNSHFNLFFFNDLQNYTLEGMSKNRRKQIKKGANNFIIKQMTDLNEFIATAHKVYVAFHARTNYSYKKERINIEGFITWAKALFSCPGILILGAYYQNQLSAISISYQVDDDIIDATFFADTESLALGISDYMVHIIREMAAKTTAHRIFKGWATGVRGLDEFKILRGCQLVEFPAWFHINPITLYTVHLFMHNKFNKIIGSI
ncbi:MAG TPA: hypothetical protein PLP19_16270 [bacterium]|nr:hypothetical protein [bacterium]HPN45048.1 hypothetical protein [bacterium]